MNKVARHDAQPLPAPTAPARLQLLCVLVKNRDGSTRQLPVHGMQPMPPRVGVSGRFDRALVTQAGFILREAHARRPAAKVVVHGVRLGQADSLILAEIERLFRMAKAGSS